MKSKLDVHRYIRIHRNVRITYSGRYGAESYPRNECYRWQRRPNSLRQGFSARNLEKNLPATPHTLLGVASYSKSFTALVIMQLIEQGLINLHDPVLDRVGFVPLDINFQVGKGYQIYSTYTMFM